MKRNRWKKKPAYRAPYEKELRFSDCNIDSIAMPIVQHFVHGTACAHIYLTVTDDNNYTTYTSEEITKYLRNRLGDLIDLLPNKTSGRGDFFLKKASRRSRTACGLFKTVGQFVRWQIIGNCMYDDSVDFVAMGFTVNQQNQ